MPAHTSPRLESLVCWMASQPAKRLAALLRDELGIAVRVELVDFDTQVYVAESDARLAHAAYLGFQLGRAR